MNIPHYTKIHNRFKLNGFHFSSDELKEIGYDFIKEGIPYEIAIGDFIMDWMDKYDYINVKTSGSTGDSKIIKISKQAMVRSAIRTGNFFNVKIGDSALHCLPADFIAGKMMLVRAMILGLSLELVEPSSSPMENLYKIYDFVAMTPMQANNSLNQLDQIKTLIIGGAPIYQDLNKKLVERHQDCFETYGMTETITHIAASKIAIPKKPFKALDGIRLSVDREGCLVVDAPDITDKLIYTNDIVDMHDSQNFTYLGRRDNVINSGGVKIFPEVIERKLANHIKLPFFVYGMPDKFFGEKLVLIVEGEERQLPEFKLDQTSLKGLDKFEVPKEILYVSKIFTNNGKYLREKTINTLIIS